LLLEPGMTLSVRHRVDKSAILIVVGINVITEAASEEPTHPLPTFACGCHPVCHCGDAAAAG
jgi:hypothetical protein